MQEPSAWAKVSREGRVQICKWVWLHTQRSPDQISSQLDNIPHVVQIIWLASSSSTRCEGDLASGKSRRAVVMAPAAHYPHVILQPRPPSPFLRVLHVLINCAYV